MKRALVGFVAGGALAAVLGFAIASLNTHLDPSDMEHVGSHVSMWCALHGAVLGANIGIFGWRDALNDYVDVLCVWR